MTKKDYTKIADTIVSIYLHNKPAFDIDPELLDNIMSEFEDTLKKDNPAFNKEMFRKYILTGIWG